MTMNTSSTMKTFKSYSAAKTAMMEADSSYGEAMRIEANDNGMRVRVSSDDELRGAWKHMTAVQESAKVQGYTVSSPWLHYYDRSCM